MYGRINRWFAVWAQIIKSLNLLLGDLWKDLRGSDELIESLEVQWSLKYSKHSKILPSSSHYVFISFEEFLFQRFS